MRIITSILLLLSALTFSLSANAFVEATLDKSETGIDDPIRLTITSDRTQGAQSIDTRALEADFTIVGQSSSSVMTMNNGSVSNTAKIFIDLLAKREGKLSIPALTVGGEQTTPIALTVVTASDRISAGESESSPATVLIETRWEDPANGDKTYVQQQLNLIVRIYHQNNLLEASLDEPQPQDALIIRLGDDIRGTADKNGVKYQTIERRYALFPQKSGRLTIPPVSLQARINDPQQQQNRRSSFDPFFRGQRVTLRSKALDADISPPEPAFGGSNWLPSVSISLNRNGLPDGPVKVGDAFNMQLEVLALGLTAEQLPELRIDESADQFKIYPDKAAFNNTTDGETVAGKRSQTFVVIPSKSGDLILPQIELVWWNTENGKQEVATLPAVSLQVSASIAQTTVIKDNAIDTPGESPSDASRVDNERVSGGVSPVWKWISIFSLSGWLLSLIGLYAYRRSGTKDKPRARIQAGTDLRPLLRLIKIAAGTNQAESTLQVLQRYARARWPLDPPKTPSEWAQQLGHSESGRIMAELESQLYRNPSYQGQSGTNWSGQSVIRVLLPELRKAEAGKAPPAENTLPPLYPEPAAGKT